jgi:radical SAM protein with 4Fe4S-binding SPASM domain
MSAFTTKRGGTPLTTEEARAAVDRAIRRGNIARSQRDWRTAGNEYAEALRLDPSLHHIWVQYGHSLKEIGWLDDAEEAYRNALHLSPGLFDTHLQLGHVLKLKGAFAEAQRAYAKAAALQPDHSEIIRELAAIRRAMGLSVRGEAFQAVIIGTTGLCNASCIHCPTGKVETAHVPRTPMPMPLFERILNEIAESGRPIRAQMSFGLFGDGLVDPFVVERAKMVRKRLPEIWLSVNTNGAAYNSERHRVLKDYASIIVVHIESLKPDVYNKLMAPLRLERVLPRIDLILQDFPKQVDISIPTNRLNVEELPTMRKRFLDAGALGVRSDPLNARCAKDHTLFNELALSSEPGSCRADILDDLIIDCDGQVLLCCNDFQRQEPVGNLASESLAAVLDGIRRKQVAEILDNGAWATMKTCSKCAYSPGLGWSDMLGTRILN